MTLRDAEVIETLRDNPELLAIADAVGETQRAPRRRRRRVVVPSVLGLAAAAVAAALVVLFWPGHSQSGVLSRALAAVGDDRVMHVVVREPSGETLVNLSTGRRISTTFESEMWIDRSSTRVHFLIRYRGRVVGETLLPQDARNPNVTTGPVDPAWEALWSGYRRALANGTAKLVGEGVVDGKPVYWLRFPPAPGSDARGTEVAIDRRSYRPVLFRERSSSGRHFDLRVLVAKTIPFSPADFVRITRGPDLLAGSSSASSAELQPRTEQELKVGKPWLTLGPTFAGMKLTSVGTSTETSGKRMVTGIQLTYGSERFGSVGPRLLTVTEFHRTTDPGEWRDVPKGFVRIQTGESTSSASQRSRPDWTGQVKKSHVFVTIETGRSEAAVIAAARQLRPAP